MRINDIFNPRNIINQFGNAWLIPRADGKHELVGGSAKDFTAAKEWVSLFAHEIVLSRRVEQRQQKSMRGIIRA
jgi:hypothetical protein